MKRFLLTFGFLLTIFSLFPQTSNAQVMFVGTHMVSFKGGIPYRSNPFHTKGSFTAGVEYAQFLKGGDYWSIALEAESNMLPKKEFFINDLTGTVTGGYNFFIIGDFARRFNLYGFTGLSLGYNLFNNGKKELEDGDVLAKTQSFLYGGKLGLHSDIYLTNQLAFSMGLGTHFMWGTISNTVVRPYFEGGIKISFY